MTVRFELPNSIEAILQRAGVDVNAQAKEAFLVELYRQSRINRPELGQSLALDRFAVDALLKRHNVVEDLPTVEELAAQRDALDRLLKRG
jgi:hypothetical protein